MAKSGEAAARLLNRLGAEVRVTEAANTPEVRERVVRLPEGTRVEVGEHSQAICDGVEVVVTSPGVPETALPLQWAAARQVPVLSELELGAQCCRVPIVAVTGSNGKTTTTTLIAELLRAGGKKAAACGNIGTPLCDVVERGDDFDFVVVEASSFQLEKIQTFRPHVAVLMNLTQNHLDRHKTFETYVRAKLRIFENQRKKDWAIYRDLDEKIIRHYGSKIVASILRFQLMRAENPVGAYLSRNEIRANWQGEDFSFCALSEIQLLGRHNLENVLAAVDAALVCGIDRAAIRSVLVRFTGVEHRLEKVGSVNGVLYVNDSKATSVDAVISALNSLKSVVWIAGGRDKGSDFAPLVPCVREKVRRAIFIGEARDKMARAVEGAAPCEKASTLKEAVEIARAAAQPGDTVLLSPGCASFDMFRNFEDRGEQFKSVVRHLVGAKLKPVSVI